MGLFRSLVHLLPRATAWRVTAEKKLRSFLEGIAGPYDDAREFVDDVYDDLHPERTRELALWERQHGLPGAGTEAQRRQALAAAWQATGGQSPSYLQSILQAAGFDVYVHEWWSSGPSPYVARDPRDYTNQPLVGTVQCGELEAQCGEPNAQCNRFLANEVYYLVNRNLTNVAPPPVPDDATKWPYFLYWGGETFPNPAPIPSARRAEFEELLLKICPAQQWLVTIVQYIPDGYSVVVIDGDYLMIDGSFVLVAAP
jgi:hypothetical protein